MPWPALSIEATYRAATTKAFMRRVPPGPLCSHSTAAVGPWQ